MGNAGQEGGVMHLLPERLFAGWVWQQPFIDWIAPSELKHLSHQRVRCTCKLFPVVIQRCFPGLGFEASNSAFDVTCSCSDCCEKDFNVGETHEAIVVQFVGYQPRSPKTTKCAGDAFSKVLGGVIADTLIVRDQTFIGFFEVMEQRLKHDLYAHPKISLIPLSAVLFAVSLELNAEDYGSGGRKCADQRTNQGRRVVRQCPTRWIADCHAKPHAESEAQHNGCVTLEPNRDFSDSPRAFSHA